MQVREDGISYRIEDGDDGTRLFQESLELAERAKTDPARVSGEKEDAGHQNMARPTMPRGPAPTA